MDEKEKPISMPLPSMPKTMVLKSHDTTIAYILQDEDFGTFPLKNTANAWWSNENTVVKLIHAFRKGYNIRQACIYAKITIDQYYYFVTIHPDFSYVKESCEQYLLMTAKDTVAGSLDKTEGAHWYLERKQRDEFGKDTLAGLQGQDSTSLIEENFFGEDGQLKISKKTLKLVESDGNKDNPKTTS